MTDTELLIRDTLSAYAEEAELADVVPAAKAQSRQLARGSHRRTPMLAWLAGPWTGRRIAAFGAAAAVVFVAIAVGVGGSSAPTASLKNQADSVRGSGGGLGYTTTAPKAASRASGFVGSHQQALRSTTATSGSVNGVAPAHAPERAGSAPDGAPNQQLSPPHDSGLGATYVVKTGDLSLTVPKGHVPSTIESLVTMARDLGGYVASSNTSDASHSVSGEVVLRIPASRFEDGVAAAAKLGKVTAQSTNANDVTGHVVDLNARLSNLKHARQTYLTILGRANTIGSTLSVQQRVDDIQDQIERLQGNLKVLHNQSADGTLTVDVNEPDNAPNAVVATHHRSGISKAWHTSVSRFNRGVNAIIAALGPLLLAAILLGIVVMLAKVILRRRGTA